VAAAAVAGAAVADGGAPSAELRDVGLGWRPELAWFLHRLDGLPFAEVVAENLDPERPHEALLQLRARVPICVHGVGLSLGGAEPLDRQRLRRLAQVAHALRAPVVSEHIAVVRVGRHDSGHLLPVPRTRAQLDVLVDHVNEAQDVLAVPLALENIAAIFAWPQHEMDDAEFLGALLRRTGAALLLDVANLHADVVNRGLDAAALLDALPLDRVAYAHVAGGTTRAHLYHDTHAHPVGEGSRAILAQLRARLPGVPVLLERDDHFPPIAELHAEWESLRVPCEVSRSSPRVALGKLRDLAAAGAVEIDALHSDQVQLLGHLCGEIPPPPGFDEDRLRVVRKSLEARRARHARPAPRSWVRRVLG
jgi:uncharacterized protein (UPF0276 family)